MYGNDRFVFCFLHISSPFGWSSTRPTHVLSGSNLTGRISLMRTPQHWTRCLPRQCCRQDGHTSRHRPSVRTTGPQSLERARNIELLLNLVSVVPGVTCSESLHVPRRGRGRHECTSVHPRSAKCRTGSRKLCPKHLRDFAGREPQVQALFVDVDDGAETTPADDHPDTLYQDFIASAPKAGMDSFCRKSPSRMGLQPRIPVAFPKHHGKKAGGTRRRKRRGTGTERARTQRSAKKLTNEATVA
jgi:hypothetical protein